MMLSRQWAGPLYLGLGALALARLDSVWHCRRTFTTSPGDITDVCGKKQEGRRTCLKAAGWFPDGFYKRGVELDPVPEPYPRSSQTGRPQAWCWCRFLLALGSCTAGSSCICRTLRTRWGRWWPAAGTCLWRSLLPGGRNRKQLHSFDAHSAPAAVDIVAKNRVFWKIRVQTTSFYWTRNECYFTSVYLKHVVSGLRVSSAPNWNLVNGEMFGSLFWFVATWTQLQAAEAAAIVFLFYIFICSVLFFPHGHLCSLFSSLQKPRRVKQSSVVLPWLKLEFSMSFTNPFIWERCHGALPNALKLFLGLYAHL